MTIKDILKKMVDKEASDLFLRINAVVRARVHGTVSYLDEHVITKEEMLKFADHLLGNADRKSIFEKDLDIDFIYDEKDVGRFRVNMFQQRGTPSAVIRHVKDEIKSFEDLNLPQKLCTQLSEESRGLILVCGPAGSGKSTTIASMLEYINQNFAKHIITIEDPVEFLFRDQRSIVNQRELGIDVHNYPQALRFVTQQSPDIIYLGTTRDVDTMKAAIDAAELGSLVVTTFHAINAVQTIERMVNFFPPHLHDEVRIQFSLILKGIVSLRLVPRKDGNGRVPAYESMVVTPTIARLIREGNTKEIQSFIDEGDLFGMRSFKKSLLQLVQDEVVDPQEARKFSDSRDEFDLALKGISRVN